jgi:hypothetical protein
VAKLKLRWLNGSGQGWEQQVFDDADFNYGDHGVFVTDHSDEEVDGSVTFVPFTSLVFVTTAKR